PTSPEHASLHVNPPTHHALDQHEQEDLTESYYRQLDELRMALTPLLGQQPSHEEDRQAGSGGSTANS
ncbi:hypothetical protein ACIHCM_35270, partial [Streptomyces sp. NPDC052023]|uniref:hypothetical protein n=1 Tax=Streptomyces sp. NPDC052023 TaxID=3365681 RepID=UPI0037D8D165